MIWYIFVGNKILKSDLKTVQVTKIKVKEVSKKRSKESSLLCMLLGGIWIFVR